jgi:hypothetical protein
MKDEHRKPLAASPAERSRLAETRTSVRRRSQADALGVVVRLEVEADHRRAEAALVEAEVNLARFGDVAEPIKRGFFAKLLKVGIVVQGKREFEAMVAARRAQLERLRTTEGPERIRRADELAGLIRAGAASPAETASAPETARAKDAPAMEPAMEIVEPVNEIEAAPPPVAERKPNGRSARSPFG